MRILVVGFALVVLALVVWLFAFGGMVDVARWAAAGQREAQTALANGLRAVRAGEPGAWLALMAICGAYGFFHAAGPGHGKLVIGGYGMGARVPVARLISLAIASSLAQAVTAIVLVAIGALVLDLGRQAMTDTAERVLAPASYIAISAIGAWLLVRGGRRLRRSLTAQKTPAQAHDHKHDHDHDHDHHHHHHHDHNHTHDHAHHHDHHHHGDAICEDCGHAHGPTLEQAEQVRSLRDAIGVISAVAIRPCTGAVFLLILCFGFGIPWAGISGALVMGLGTASVTVLVAVASVTLRESALAPLQGTSAVRAMAAIEMLAGAGVAVIATGIALRMLSL